MSGIPTCAIALAGLAVVGTGAAALGLGADATLLKAAASYAAGVLGNWGFDRAQALSRAYVKRPGQPTEENHVIVRALRRIQIEALQEVRAKWNAARAGDRDPRHRSDEDPFDAWLADYLQKEAQRAKTLTVQELPPLTEQDWAAIGQAESDWAGLAVQAGLAGRHGSPAALSEWGTKATRLMAAELRFGFGDSLPPSFINALVGSDPAASPWFGLLIRKSAAAIRSDPGFRHTWEVEQQAVIRYLAEQISAGIGDLTKAMPRITGILTDFGTRLDAVAGDVAAVKSVVLQIQAALTDVSPWLAFLEMGTDGLLRFAPWNPAIPFVGRAEEMAALDGFLNSDAPFEWWTMTGPGGAGKTRVARELCWRAHAAFWRVGFLQGPPPELWRPQGDLLIVVDYAGAKMDWVRTLGQRLASQCAAPARVRLLLIERQADKPFWDQLYGAGMELRGMLEPRRHAGQPLPISELSESDLWTIVQKRSWMVRSSSLKLDRATFFRRLTDVDKDRRALVALMLAEAEGGVLGGDLPDLLRDLIRKTKERFWPKGMPGQADLLITAATMVGVLDGRLLETVDARAGHVKGAELRLCAAAIGAKPADHRALIGIQPDLIGEFFALETLRSDPWDPPPLPWLAELVWREAPERVWQFCLRAVQNFPDHDAIGLIMRPPRDAPDAAFWFGQLVWAVSAVETVRVPWPLRHALLEELRALARAWPDAAAVREQLANGLFNTLIDAKAKDRLELRDALLEELRALARAWPDDAAVRERLAKGLVNTLIDAKAEDRLELRDALLEELRALARAWPDDAAVRERLAKGLVNTLNDAKAKDRLELRDALLEELRALARAWPDDAAVREQLANGLFNTLIDAKAEDRLELRDALLEELRALARAWPDDAAVREQLANGLFNTLIYAKAEDWLELRDALLEELRALARAWPDAAAVREQLANGLFNTLNDAKAKDRLELRDALLEELRALARAWPDAAAVREQLANGLFNTLIDAKAKDRLELRDALLEELRALARAWPDDAAVRERLAKGLVNTLIDAKAEDRLELRDALLEELRALARAWPDDAAVRERLAKGLVNTLNDAKAKDRLELRDALLEELRALARAWPDDAAVREQLANGLFNTLIYAKAEDRLELRDALLEELRALARAWPDDAAVRKRLANGIGFAAVWSAESGDAAMRDALLAELVTLAQQYPLDLPVHESLTLVRQILQGE